MLYIKRFLAQLSRDIKQEKITEKDIDRAGGDSGAIKFMKEIWGNSKINLRTK